MASDGSSYSVGPGLHRVGLERRAQVEMEKRGREVVKPAVKLEVALDSSANTGRSDCGEEVRRTEPIAAARQFSNCSHRCYYFVSINWSPKIGVTGSEYSDIEIEYLFTVTDPTGTWELRMVSCAVHHFRLFISPGNPRSRVRSLSDPCFTS